MRSMGRPVTEVLAACLVVMSLLCGTPALAHDTAFPEQTLKKVFPEATGFTPRKKTLTAEQIRQIEQSSGSKLERNDNPLNFYVALGKSSDGSGVLGTVVMVDARGAKGTIDLAVALNRDGSIHSVAVLENKDEAGLAAPTFLDQFKGKTPQSLNLGKEIRYSGNPKSAQSFVGAVRRGVFLLAAAAGKA